MGHGATPQSDPPAAGENTAILSHHFRTNRGKIAVTYAVLAAENGLDLLYPLLIGLAINGLLAGEVWSLAPLAGVWLVHILIAAARQLYDTRLFSTIYANISADLAQRDGAEEDGLSRVAAHVDMVEEVVEFYEFDVPNIATVLIALIGAMGLMFIYDTIAGVMVIALLVPALAINMWLAKRSLRLNRVLNGEYERQVDIVATGLASRIGLHFSRVRRMRVALSNAEAFAWSVLEILTLAVTMAVIAQLASVPGANAGSIFAGTVYMLRIVAELDRVPELIQRGSLLVDIRRRLNTLD
ncbi:MAG: ABC transporter six-transmembrane domain-containing protein [Erythrobacter sp.]